jgi:hypothetical protein
MGMTKNNMQAVLSHLDKASKSLKSLSNQRGTIKWLTKALISRIS